MDVGLIAVVLIALAFDYTNGFHDAANAIATAVSTRALTPRVSKKRPTLRPMRSRVDSARGRSTV